METYSLTLRGTNGLVVWSAKCQGEIKFVQQFAYDQLLSIGNDKLQIEIYADSSKGYICRVEVGVTKSMLLS